MQISAPGKDAKSIIIKITDKAKQKQGARSKTAAPDRAMLGGLTSHTGAR
jgi:hypothetical protein